MHEHSPRTISVRRGLVEPNGSWLYVWLDDSDGAVVYVGGTGFDPELRTYLHVTSESPDLGRVRAAVPGFAHRDFTVLAFAVPPDVPRPDAKAALLVRLDSLGWFLSPEVEGPALPGIIEPFVAALARERRARGTDSRDG